MRRAWSGIVCFAVMACSSSSSSSTASDAGTRSADGGGLGDPTVATAAGSLSETITVKASNTTCNIAMTIAGIEDRSVPWLCPSCTTTYRSPLTFTSGGDCLASLLGGQTPEDMFFGWSTEGNFYLVFGYDHAATSPALGRVTLDATVSHAQVTTSLENDLVKRSGTGQLSLGRAGGDPLHGWVASPAYACGWPKTNPPPYTAGYEPKMGDKMPDGVFLDPCGDKVRLHDLLGRYLLLHMNQTDSGCNPCNDAAAGQAKFEADMKAAGIETLVVAMEVPSFKKPNYTVAPESLKTWLTTNGVSGLVLADRGMGNAVFNPLAANFDPTKLALPSFVLVAPDGTLLSATVGWDSRDPNTWAQFETMIHAHAGR